DAAKAPEGKAEGTDRAESTDVPEATDKLAEITEKADKQAERIERLQQQVERRDDRIDKLEDRLERKDELIAKLQSELARARGDTGAADTTPDDAPEAGGDAAGLESRAQDTPAEEQSEKRGRRIALPSSETIGVVSGLIGGGEAVGAVTHTLTSGEQGLIGAGTTLGVAGFLLVKKKIEEHRKNDDRPED
ncbi:MAG: hypothetical protein FWE15_04760, partial [Actinomycetia bacterium]|nr:hypothetical protein [Actinomycetes bacterium]